MKPRYECPPCEDWGIVIAPDGHGTVRCTACQDPKPPTAPAAEPNPQDGTK